MKRIILATAIIAMTSATALAARGDNGEGQGGGRGGGSSGTIAATAHTEYYTEYENQLVTVMETQYYQETRYNTEPRTRTVQVTVPYTEAFRHPAALSGACASKSDFADFSTGCKIEPAWIETLHKTRIENRTEHYTVQVPYQVTLSREVPVQRWQSVPVQRSRTTYSCPRNYRLVNINRCQRIPDRGNGGNR